MKHGIRAYVAAFTAAAFVASALLVGCDREVSHKDSSTVEKDGTVKSKEKTVKESPDGTVTKQEQTKKTSPTNSP